MANKETYAQLRERVNAGRPAATGTGGSGKGGYSALRTQIIGEAMPTTFLPDPLPKATPAVQVPMSDDDITAKNMETFGSWDKGDQTALSNWLQYRPGGAWDLFNAMINAGMGVTPGYHQMMDTARASAGYQELGDKHGEQETARVANSLERERNAQVTQNVREESRRMAEGGNIGHDLMSIVTKNLGDKLNLLGLASAASLETGQYQSADPNHWGNLLNVYTQEARQQGAQNFGRRFIQGGLGFDYGKLEGTAAGKAADEIGSVIYNGAMSWADSALRGAEAVGWIGNMGLNLDPKTLDKAAEHLSSAMAAMGTLASSYTENAQQGHGKLESLGVAVVDAGMEYLSELINLDNLFKIARGDALSAGQIVGNLFKQAGIESSTEVIGMVASTLGEIAILGKDSELLEAVEGYREAGEEHPWGKALLDYGIDVARTAGSAYVSGLLGGGGATMAQLANRGQSNQQTQQTQQTQEAPAQGESTQPPRTEQAQMPEQTQPEQTVPTALGTALEGYRQNGKVSNNQAAAILADTEALAALQAQVPFELPGTASGNRAAVKAAVEQLAQNSAQETTQEPVQAQPEQTEPAEGAEQQPVQTAREEALEPVEEGWAAENKNGIREMLADIQRGATPEELLAKSQGYAREYEQLQAGKPYGQAYTDEETGRLRTLTFLRGLYADAARDPSGTAKMYGDFLADTEAGANQEAYVYDRNGRRELKTDPFTAAVMDLDGGNREGKAPVRGGDGSMRIVDIPAQSMRDGQPAAATTGAIFQVGQRVRASDRGNIGTVTGYDRDTGLYRVTFRSREGLAQTVEFAPNEIMPTGKRQTNKESAKAEGPEVKIPKAPEGMKVSGVYDNTVRNATDPEIKKSGAMALEADPGVAFYKPTSEKETRAEAAERTSTQEKTDAEYDNLMGKESWTAADNDTAFKVLKELAKANDTQRHSALAKKQRENATNAGQFVQSFAKYSRESAQTAADDAITRLGEMSYGDVPKRYWGKGLAKNATAAEKTLAFETWRSNVVKAIEDIATRIEGVSEDDPEGMRAIVRELARLRRTTAFLGTKNELTRIADRGINSLDYETAKAIAKAQVSQIPNDFRKVSMAEVIKTSRIMNMLASLTSTNRNLAGNATVGFLDSLNDSTAGRAMDAIIGKFTGKRTIGNDIKYSGEYLRAAKKAAGMAALCVELAIPMEEDGKYVGTGRTFSPSGNLVTRWMSAMEKAMSYSLEVTDRFFQGGTEGAVAKSLNGIMSLTEDEAKEIAANTGKRRTYKEGRQLARVSADIKRGLNRLSIGSGDNAFGLGDAVMPFANIPAEVAQTGIDYSAVGLLNSFRQVADVIARAKRGEEVTALEQRTAAGNFGRGVSGVAMTALFAALAGAGVIRVHDEEDKDRNALEQALGLDGAQLNISAAIRALRGESTQWRPDDIKVSLDFLEPFNAQMYIGYMLAQEDDFASAAAALPGATVAGIAESVMELPMMQGMSDLMEVVQSFAEADEDPDAVKNAVGQAAGNLISGVVPSWLRQVAQYTDPYYRDTSGSNWMERAGNQLLASVPGVSQMLPAKYDGLGNPQMRYTNDALGFFNTFLSPGKITGQTAPESAYEISEFLSSLSESTGSDKAYPDSKPPKSFTLDGEEYTMTQSQQNRYQNVYGRKLSGFYGDLLENDVFLSLPPELQEKVMLRAKAEADNAAKAYIADGGRDIPPTAGADDFIRAELASYMSEGFSLQKQGKSAMGAENLETALDIYRGMDSAERKRFLEDNGGRATYFIHAAEEGMSAERFLGFYKEYQRIDGTNQGISEKAQDWSHYLQTAYERGDITKGQLETMKNDMVFRYSGVVDTAKYDAMVESGIKGEPANNVVNLIAGLEPRKGYSTVREIEKAEAIVGAGLNQADTVAALHVYLNDSKDEDLDAMLAMGYGPREFWTAWDIFSGESGTGKKGRIIRAYMDEFGIDYAQAKQIYDIYG